MMLKAVILIGGPSKGTRFRPLSLDIPKPLFPVAGLPLVEHHINACYRLARYTSKYRVAEVLLLGYYADDELSEFLLTATHTYPSLKIRYLREPSALGTAGGLYHFRDTILAPIYKDGDVVPEQVQGFFVMNGDVCADFPLEDMLDMHFDSRPQANNQNQPVIITVMATETTRQQSVHYGCMVIDKETNIIQHYVEKPSTVVSTIVNCGVYLCSPLLFNTLAEIHSEISNLNKNNSQHHTSSISDRAHDVINRQQQMPAKVQTVSAVVMWMEQDVLRRLAGESKSVSCSVDDECRNLKQKVVSKGVAKATCTLKWWSQLKTAGGAIYANRHYLALRQRPKQTLQGLFHMPAPPNGQLITVTPVEYSTIGNVYVHYSAHVHPTALLGPNVSIGPGVYIDKGVRIKESIILHDAVIGQHSLVMHSIIGKHSKLGSWCRVEGSTTCSDPNPNVAYAKMTPQLPLFNIVNGRLNPTITILGRDVNVESEIVLLNSIVLPYKVLTRSYKNEIIL